jgi:hypothetical protein
MTAEIFDGRVSGGVLEWKVKLRQMRMTLVFITEVAGGAMQGEVKAGFFGTFKLSGERVQQG